MTINSNLLIGFRLLMYNLNREVLINKPVIVSKSIDNIMENRG